MTLVPGWDFRGTAPFGSLANGDVFRPFTPQASGPCPALGNTIEARCLILQWTAGQSADDQQRGAGDRIVWHGSLLEGKRDQVGFDYRRNRVYDPATGRFTQQDPIGLAGGINSYGFPKGDPVSYTDPFGLCPPNDTNLGPDCPGFWAGLLGAVGAVVGGVSGGTGGALACAPAVVGALPCGTAGGMAGAAKGFAVGTAIGLGVDLLVMKMADAGKPGNRGPNEDFNRIAREEGLTTAGARFLHEQISKLGEGLEEIRELARDIYQNYPKFRASPPK